MNEPITEADAQELQRQLAEREAELQRLKERIGELERELTLMRQQLTSRDRVLDVVEDILLQDTPPHHGAEDPGDR